MSNITLSGTEVLQVLPIQTNGLPAATTGQTTTQAIANLAAGAGLARGSFVANGTTTVVVAAPTVAATSVIGISIKTLGGTQGAQPTPISITAGVGFSVVATALDTSTYNFVVL